MNIEKSPERLAVLDKINELERLGEFSRDVEEDPPTEPLTEPIDYAAKKFSTRARAWLANIVAKAWFEREIRRKHFIVKDVIGGKNLAAVKSGAILTCNHFNAYDNYAVLKAAKPFMKQKRLWKIIREGNYTSFPGLFGFFFRNCNTLPLATSRKVLKSFFEGVSELLSKNEKILIYPEQGMWWNYRKPRPLKDGGFYLAAKNNVPVVPFFISMEDTDVICADGFPAQAYTVHIMPAIYPDSSLSVPKNTALMLEKNYSMLKAKYEEVYKIPLTYSNE